MSFRLRTRRLYLEDLTCDDLENLKRIADDREVLRYVLIWLEEEAQILAFLRRAVETASQPERGAYILLVRISDSHEFAGIAFLEIDPVMRSTGEVGIVLLGEYQARGYGREILECLLSFGFRTLRLHRIFGKCDELNGASARLMERCGMKYEGTLREHVWLRDHWRSSRYYGMLAREFESRREGPCS